MFDYAQLEEELKKIAALADKQPEKYQVKCFELLVNALLSGAAPAKIAIAAPETAPQKTNASPFKIPITVRAFLSQYKLNEDVINRLFVVDGNQISPTYNITETKVATAQMHFSLLLAFENALLTSKFTFSIEIVRARCKQNKSYDSINFTTNFKTNKRLFNSLSDPENVELSPDGKAELADVISGLAK